MDAKYLNAVELYETGVPVRKVLKICSISHAKFCEALDYCKSIRKVVEHYNKPGRAIKSRGKEAGLKLYEIGATSAQISKGLNVTTKTAQAWVREWRATRKQPIIIGNKDVRQKLINVISNSKIDNEKIRDLLLHLAVWDAAASNFIKQWICEVTEK